MFMERDYTRFDSHVNTHFNPLECDDDAMASATTPIGETLKRLLARTGENAHALAEKIGVSQPTLHRIIHGDTRTPTGDTMRKMAKFFSLTLEDLYTGNIGTHTAVAPPVTQQSAPMSSSTIGDLHGRRVDDALARLRQIAPRTAETIEKQIRDSLAAAELLSGDLAGNTQGATDQHAEDSTKESRPFRKAG